MSSDAPQAISDSSDDEDLKLALALSLKDDQSSANTSPAKPYGRQSIHDGEDLVTLDSDEDDDNLDLPGHISESRLGVGGDSYGARVGSGSSIFTRPHSNLSSNGTGTVKGSKGQFRREAASSPRKPPVKSPVKGILGMDRAAMEAERLARASKRKAPISPPPLRGNQKRSNNEHTPPGKKTKDSNPIVAQPLIRSESPPDLEFIESEPRSKENKTCESHQRESRSQLGIDTRKAQFENRKDREPPSSQTSCYLDIDLDPEVVTSKLPSQSLGEARLTASRSLFLPKPSPDLEILASEPKTYKTPNLTGLNFPHGTVLKTWAFGHERLDDIKIEEVLQRSTLKFAVISSFQWDMEWLRTKLNYARTKIVFVMQAKGEAQRARYREETKDAPNLRLCFPPMDPMVNCMHSKLMLLSHPEYIRVVVPTANCTPYDWGDIITGAVMENSVFLVDLPRLPEGKRTKWKDMTGFGRELIYFLDAMGLQKEIMQSLYAFDFSATSGLTFVHTIGGAHTGEAWQRTGYCGLGRAIKEMGLATDLELDIDYIASSIGAVNREFLMALYLAVQGNDGMKEYTLRYGAANASVRAQGQVTTSLTPGFLESLDKRFRIFFPSEDTVISSKGGKDCAGVICFQKKWWNGPNFPQKALRDCKSKREGLLMHNKVCSVVLCETPSLLATLIGNLDHVCSTHSQGKVNIVTVQGLGLCGICEPI